MLQVTTANQCPQLTTSTSPYTLHISVNEQLLISGRSFIEVSTNVTIAMYSYYCGTRLITIHMNNKDVTQDLVQGPVLHLCCPYIHIAIHYVQFGRSVADLTIINVM